MDTRIETEKEATPLSPAVKGTVAVLLDDVLNNFSETVNLNGIIYDRRIHTFSDPDLKRTIYNLETGVLTAAGQAIMRDVRPDGAAAALLKRLAGSGWKIIIATDRDLRFSSGITKQWLAENAIPYSVLYRMDDPTGFCRRLGIGVLICGKPKRERHGFSVGCAAFEKTGCSVKRLHFGSFEDFERWMEKKSF